MKKKVLTIVICFIIVAALTVALIIGILPVINKDWEGLYQQDLQSHEQKLDIIESDFNRALAYDNVHLEISDGYVAISISGDACTLNTKLNRELHVIEYEVINHTTGKKAGLTMLAIITALAMAGLTAGIIIDFIEIRRISKANKARRAESQIGPNVIV